jgi:para-nitrobenzyl esterase
MIFGHSGGGRRWRRCWRWPSAKGLFHRAVIESGATLRLVEADHGTRVAHAN